MGQNYAFHTIIVVLAVVLFCGASSSWAKASDDVLRIPLTLPFDKTTQKKVEAPLHHVGLGLIHIFYEDDLLDGEEGKLWVGSMVPVLEKGYGVYRQLLAT